MYLREYLEKRGKSSEKTYFEGGQASIQNAKAIFQIRKKCDQPVIGYIHATAYVFSHPNPNSSGCADSTEMMGIISDLKRLDVNWGSISYPTPIPKMRVNATLLPRAICKRQRIGIGNTTVVRSSKRLNTATNMSKCFCSPQWPPSIVRSHLYAIGRHIRHVVRIIAVKKRTLIASAT